MLISNNPRFQAFVEAKSPVQPYIFNIWDVEEADEVEEQTLTNMKTNEEFSIRRQKTPNENMHGIEVKRVVKKKKDGIKKD